MIFLTYIIALLILIVILKILTFPIRVICRFLINSLIGGIVLYFLAKIGIFITITWWSILLTGIFGIPGVIISFLLTIFMI